MEQNPQLKKKTTKKMKMLYNRKRTNSADANLDKILGMDPKEMTQEQKVQWKVEIFRQMEDTDDYVQNKLDEYSKVNEELKQIIDESKNMITTYNDAVESINKAANHAMPIVEQIKQNNQDNTLQIKNYMKPRDSNS